MWWWWLQILARYFEVVAIGCKGCGGGCMCQKVYGGGFRWLHCVLLWLWWVVTRRVEVAANICNLRGRGCRWLHAMKVIAGVWGGLSWLQDVSALSGW